jgi:predicted CXXCH cytochrome family protein
MHNLACKDCHCPPSLPSRLPHPSGTPSADAAQAADASLPPWSSAVCLGCHESVRSEPAGTSPHGASGEQPPSRVCVQHRVGIVYGEWVGPPAMVRRTPPRDLPLFGPDQRVECATCHGVHGTASPHLLRASIVGSVLCGKCH